MSNAPPALSVKANGQPGVAPAGGSTVQPGGQGKTDKFGEAPMASMSQLGVDCRAVLKEFSFVLETMDDQGREIWRSPNTGDFIILHPSGLCSAARRDGKRLRVTGSVGELRHHLKAREQNK